MAFYHDCWDMVGKDTMKVFQEFSYVLYHGKLEKSINMSFIVIILKIVGGLLR